MYFIDRNEINNSLQHMERLLALFESEENWFGDDLHELALERIAHGLIECIIDVGNSMIDGFIMRDPGSYEDIIDIMDDEKVISQEMITPLKDVVELRKMIVRDFTRVDCAKVEQEIAKSINALKEFPPAVRAYLENELGPVSAFLPENTNETL